MCGAPDPTAGASANDQTNWYLDEKTLHDNIKKILIKFCLPAPMVFSDVNYLTNSAPPAAAEWSSLLRPLRGREPEGMWNLLSIVREMYKRCDRNAIRLLEIITEECLACDQILVWWFNTKLSLLFGTAGHSGGGGGGKHSNTHSNANASQHACSSLCDEIVVLWRLAALNPGLAPDERDLLHAQFTAWHLKILDRIVKCRVQSSAYSNKHQSNLRTDAELFIGFKPAIEACYLDWEEYPIAGITHTQDTNPMYHCPFTCFKHAEAKCDGAASSHVNSSQAVLAATTHKRYNYFVSDHNHQLKRTYRASYISSSNDSSNSSSDSVNVRLAATTGGVAGGGIVIGVGAGSGAITRNNDCNRSSASSEGFCENDDDGADSSGAGASGEISINPAALVVAAAAAAAAKGNMMDSQAESSSSSSSSTELRTNAHLVGSNAVNTIVSMDYSSLSNSKILEYVEKFSRPPDAPPIEYAGVPMTMTAPPNHPHHIVMLGSDVPPKQCANTEPASISSAPQPSTSKVAAASSTPTASADAVAEERRPSKDESLSSSASLSDEFNMYYYDSSKANQRNLEQQARNEQSNNKSQIFSNIKPTEDAWDILFARAEGLHAHGHGREACILAVRLAEELLAHPPNLMIELPPPMKRKGKKSNVNPISHQLSVLASGTLAKCAFLCIVLAENSEHYHLGFRICLFGLEMPRPPASTKPLEVKLANQENDLLALLKRIPLGQPELQVSVNVRIGIKTDSY